MLVGSGNPGIFSCSSLSVRPTDENPSDNNSRSSNPITHKQRQEKESIVYSMRQRLVFKFCRAEQRLNPCQRVIEITICLNFYSDLSKQIESPISPVVALHAG